MKERKRIDLDYSKIEDIKIDYSGSTYPDFEDSFIVSATYDGRDMTDDELDTLNEDHDFVYEQALKQAF